MFQLISILSALIIGYCCKNLLIKDIWLNRILNGVVYFILMTMGYQFGAEINQMLQEIIILSKIIVTATLLLLLLNWTGIYFLTEFLTTKKSINKAIITESLTMGKYVLASAQYLIFLFLGMMLGWFLQLKLIYINNIVTLMIFIILFIIGHQLRLQKISLKNILINHLGIKIIIAVLISSLICGLIISLLFGLSLKTELTLCSGFGWYTLSGILAGQLINHQIGLTVFFIDFIREVITIILIPIIGYKIPYLMVGYSGATALDFSLAVIKINLGKEIVPIAITSGMGLTILVPIIITLINF